MNIQQSFNAKWPHFMVSPKADKLRGPVATLGPVGTSSECAAHAFLELNDAIGQEIRLYETYLQACDAVLHEQCRSLVVANAFHAANLFYMNPRLAVDCVFHMYTPLYGLAAVTPDTLTGTYPIISHPAPVPLLSELLPERHRCTEVVHANSTSAAASAVARGEYPVALTTEPAAANHGLTFFSSCRPIEMVWTVFTRVEGARDV